MAAGMGMDFGSQAFGYGLNAMAASKAWDRQKNLMTRGPGYEMQGLRAAGLNPILAATGGWKGASSASVPQAAPASSHKQGVTNMLAARQGKLLEAQANAQDAAAMKSEHEAQLASAKRMLANLELPKAINMANYHNTRTARDLIRQQHTKDASPSSWSQLLSAIVTEMMNSAKDVDEPKSGSEWTPFESLWQR